MNAIGAFELDAAEARSLAQTFGTPLYVVDDAHFRSNIRRYKEAQGTKFTTKLYYASKANPSPALMRIAYSEGLHIDVASIGEFDAALYGGVPAADCNFHGNAKSDAELRSSIASGIGSITVDEPSELERIAQLVHELQLTSPRIMLRLLPGVDPITHPHVRTGQYDSKFGIPISDGSARRAVTHCLALRLPLAGFHAHVGSQLLDSEAQCLSAGILASFALEVFDATGFAVEELNLGGGVGVRYVESQPNIDLAEYCNQVHHAATSPFMAAGRPVPILSQEPGRALIANACSTLYTVAAIKPIPTGDGKQQVFVAIDGGLSDNPRPALYQSAYTVQVVPEPHHGTGVSQATLSGKHCETDTMFRSVNVPDGLARGDLVQVLAGGAYQLSMASNYNRYPRPAMVLRRLDGSYDCIQEREKQETLLMRDRIPEDLRWTSSTQ